MSIRRVSCPSCGVTVNVPAGMAMVKCPKCGNVWNVNNPDASAADPASPAKKATNKAGRSGKGLSTAAIGGIVSGAVALLALAGVGAFLMLGSGSSGSGSSAADTAAAPAAEQTAVAASDSSASETEAAPIEYREIRLPEETRKRIYEDYRRAARSSVEKKIPMLGEGNAVERMLGETVDREIRRFAALHDVTEEDIREVIKEGDAKDWGDSKQFR